MNITEEDTIWEMVPHTQAKHDLLKRYLQAWFPILSSRSSGLNYIDGFAGPGLYKKGEVGSPVIAIEVVKDHQLKITSNIVFLFIERHAERAESLRKVLMERFPDLSDNIVYDVCCSPYDETMKEVFDRIEEKGSLLSPTFAFLDPFGYSGMPMELTERLFKFRSCEVLITFMAKFINRFAQVEDKRSREYDMLYGTQKWREVRKIKNPEERKNFLLTLYETQLKEKCKASFVRSFEMMDKFNQTIYYLVFATTHWKGMRAMKTAMWKTDTTGQYKFNDRTNPNQTFLVDYSDEEFWIDQAAKMIAENFRGRTVSVRVIERYVITETPFLFRKKSLKILEESSPPKIIDVQNRRRKGTYPNGCKIKFSK